MIHGVKSESFFPVSISQSILTAKGNEGLCLAVGKEHNYPLLPL